MSKEVKSEDVMVQDYINSTNKLIRSLKGYNKQLFESVRVSYEMLYDPTKKKNDPENKGWKLYKLQVELDDSTINKIVKIVSNDIIMENFENLPGSWGTLYVLCSMDENDLLEVIRNSRINKQSTKKDVIEIRDEYKGTTSTNPLSTNDKETWEVNHLWIDIDSLNVTDDVRVRVEEIFNELESYGFKITNDKQSESTD